MAVRDFLKSVLQKKLTIPGQPTIISAVESFPALFKKSQAAPAPSPLPPPPPVPMRNREVMPGEIAIPTAELDAKANLSKVQAGRQAATMTAPTTGQKDGTVTKNPPPAPAAPTVPPPAPGLPGGSDPAMAVPGPVLSANSATPAAPAAPVVSEAEKQRAALETRLLGLMGAPAQSEAETQLADISARQAAIEAAAGMSKAASADQPIEMGFITGQQAAIERRAQTALAAEAAKAVPLQTRIAQEQARRTAEKEQAAAELGFTEARITREEAAKAGKMETVKPGDRLVQIGPDGKATEIYNAPAEAAKRNTQIVNIGGQATVVDKDTGEVIHVIGKAGSGTAAGSGSTGEFTGKLSATAEMVLKNPALLTNFTPTDRGKILKELAASGADTAGFTVEKLSAGQRDQIALFDEIEQEGLTSNTLIGSQNLGPIMSRAKTLGAMIGLAPAEFTDLRSSINNMSSILLRMRSGAAVTPQEYERIRGFIPELNDDETTMKRKAARFISEISAAKANYIKRATQTSQEILASVGTQTGFNQAAPATTGLDDLDFTMQ